MFPRWLEKKHRPRGNSRWGRGQSPEMTALSLASVRFEAFSPICRGQEPNRLVIPGRMTYRGPAWGDLKLGSQGFRRWGSIAAERASLTTCLLPPSLPLTHRPTTHDGRTRSPHHRSLSTLVHLPPGILTCLSDSHRPMTSCRWSYRRSEYYLWARVGLATFA
jgi:hypothetical protein